MSDHPVIAPEDIRPGDVVRISRDVEVRSAIVSDFAPGGLLITDVKAKQYNSAGATLHLVSRPDPNAEAVEALARVMHDDRCSDECCDGCDMGDYEHDAERIIHSARERGWDIVRRAES